MILTALGLSFIRCPGNADSHNRCAHDAGNRSQVGIAVVSRGLPFQVAHHVCHVVAIAAMFAHSVCFAVETIPSGKGLRLSPVGGRPYPPVITALAISSDGKTLAAAGDDHAIRLLNGVNFSRERVIGFHEDWVRSLDFAPDDSLLLSCGNDGVIQAWQAAKNWKDPKIYEGGPALACIKFNASGKQVAAAGFSPELFLMRMGNSPRLKMTCDCRDLRTVEFFANDTRLVCGGRTGELHFFDLQLKQELEPIASHLGRLRDCTILRGTHQLVTVGEDSRCVVVDLQKRKKIDEIRVPGCKLLSVAKIDGTHVAVGGSDNIIRVINVKRGEVTKRLVGHQGSVAVLISCDEHLISGSYDTSIRFWKRETILDRDSIAVANANLGDVLITDRKAPENVK